jgi:hypothetical protein
LYTRGGIYCPLWHSVGNMCWEYIAMLLSLSEHANNKSQIQLWWKKQENIGWQSGGRQKINKKTVDVYYLISINFFLAFFKLNYQLNTQQIVWKYVQNFFDHRKNTRFMNLTTFWTKTILRCVNNFWSVKLFLEYICQIFYMFM